LFTWKKPNLDTITPEDYEKNKSILLMTSSYLEQYCPDTNIHVLRGPKYRNVISKLFSKKPAGQQPCAGLASKRKWLKY
jgi:hypothetical protein